MSVVFVFAAIFMD